jgi:hypothetical protein
LFLTQLTMKLSPVSRLIQPCLLLILFAVCGPAQADKPQADKPKAETDDKAEQIVQRAIKAVGGDRYLAVRTLIGRGFFTDYKDGVPGIPTKFVDYLVYPDRERTEFNGGGVRTIQTNDRGKGWIYDGAALTLKDQSASQLEDFRILMRTSVENLLRGWWRKDGATLSYVGRREAGLARRNETVRLTYPDGLWIEYEFAASDGLPAKVLYQRKQKKADSDEKENISEEDRLFKPITIDGVLTPYVIDHYRNGTQTSRINYDSLELNKPIADSLFAKPASFKAVK